MYCLRPILTVSLQSKPTTASGRSWVSVGFSPDIRTLTTALFPNADPKSPFGRKHTRLIGGATLARFRYKQREDKLASALGGGLRRKLLWVRVGRIVALHHASRGNSSGTKN